MDGHPLAPNGKRSNLNEDQWATVRTANFKRWFGDWHGINILEKLNGTPITELQTSSVPVGSFAELREWAAGLFQKQGGIATSPLIGEVVLSKASVRDSLAHGGADRFKRTAFLAVKDVIEKGTLVHSASDSEKVSHYFSAPVMMDGRRQVVTVLVRRHPQSQRMYLHSVTAQENLRTPRVSGAGNQLASSTDAEGVWNILHNALSVNPETVSKVVDENGEPRVVFHGTAAEFDTFDPQRAGETFDYDKEGIFFAGYESDAVDYAKHAARTKGGTAKVIHGFLNIRNPYTYNDHADEFGDAQTAEKGMDGRLLIDWADMYRRDHLRSAQEMGRDGIIIERGNEGLFTAFEPNQIKSATDNNGDFSEAPSMLRSSPTQPTSQPSPGSLRAFINSAFNLPPASYEYQQSNENRPSILEIARQNGIELVDSPDLRDSFRRFSERTGASAIFYRGGQAEVAGFTPRSNPELIFINADRADVPISSTIGHELLHVAQKDGAIDSSAVAQKAIELLQPEELLALENTLLQKGYSLDSLVTEIPALLMADAVSGYNAIGLEALANGPALAEYLVEFFDSLPFLNPQGLRESPDNELAKTPTQPDLFTAATAPDAAETLGDVKAGRMNALRAYRTLTAKRNAGKPLTATEEQQLLDAETALGQKLAFDMEAVKSSVQPKNGSENFDEFSRKQSADIGHIMDYMPRMRDRLAFVEALAKVKRRKMKPLDDMLEEHEKEWLGDAAAGHPQLWKALKRAGLVDKIGALGSSEGPDANTGRIGPVDVPDAIILHGLGATAEHPSYKSAKAGDPRAALALAKDLVNQASLEAVKRQIGDSRPIVVPVLAIEESGRNMIPAMTATLMAGRLGLEVADQIIQSVKAHRGGKSALDRVFSQSAFDGPVTAGADYLFVDDTLTQGGTFAALASHIQANGWRVVGVVALTGKQYSAKLQPSNELLGEIRDKFGDVESDFRRAAGYGFDRLTESEARALVRFRPADAIRSRIVAEAHEKGGRLDGEGTGQGLTLGSSEGPESAAVQAALDKLPEKFRHERISKLPWCTMTIDKTSNGP